jgi:hypothetical protein
MKLIGYLMIIISQFYHLFMNWYNNRLLPLIRQFLRIPNIYCAQPLWRERYLFPSPCGHQFRWCGPGASIPLEEKP